MCVTSSTVRTEEKACWLLSLKLYSCRYGGKNILWGKCPRSGITPLLITAMPFTPLFGKDSGKSRMHPKQLQASKYSSGVQTCKWWESYFYTEKRRNGHMPFLKWWGSLYLTSSTLQLQTAASAQENLTSSAPPHITKCGINQEGHRQKWPYNLIALKLEDPRLSAL